MDFTIFSDIVSTAFKTPFETWHLIIFIIFIFSIAILVIFASSLPILENYMKEIEIYNFILQFKNFTSEEISTIENLIKKYHIKTKYKLLVSQATFEKYINMEIISIEDSILPKNQKIEKINFYHNLKKKLFYTDK